METAEQRRRLLGGGRSVVSDGTRRPFLQAATGAFLLLVALLPWMKYGIIIFGLEAYPVDFLFVLTFGLWVAALATGQAHFHGHRSFVLLGLYFAAMAVSAAASEDRAVSAFKLLTQVYLLLLPVLAFNLIRTEAELKRVFLWWLVPALAVASYGVVTLLLFPFFGWHSFLREPLHNFGTLPAGPYPRIELTFTYPSMLANYLGVSLMLLLLAYNRGWISRRATLAGAAALLASAFFALTPGFGGVVAMLFVWVWYRTRDRQPLVARGALVAAAGVSLLQVVVAAVTPFLHWTAPFLIHVPGLSAPLAPSVRLMGWIAAFQNFLSSPIFGHGIGLDAVRVLYQAPEDVVPGYLTDAHNFILNIAAESGILGVAALFAIVWHVLRQALAAAHPGDDKMVQFGLAIAWLSGFVIEGLVGSFEDVRHLWILFGMLACASRFAGNSTATTTSPELAERQTMCHL